MERPERVLVCEVADDRYAFEFQRVIEVATDPHPAPLPLSPPELLGVWNLRGRLIPLLDLAALLGGEPPPSFPYAVVVETTHGRSALAVGRIPFAGDLGAPAGETSGAAARGAFRVGEIVVVRVDLEALLSEWLHRSREVLA